MRDKENIHALLDEARTALQPGMKRRIRCLMPQCFNSQISYTQGVQLLEQEDGNREQNKHPRIHKEAVNLQKSLRRYRTEAVET